MDPLIDSPIRYHDYEQSCFKTLDIRDSHAAISSSIKSCISRMYGRSAFVLELLVHRASRTAGLRPLLVDEAVESRLSYLWHGGRRTRTISVPIDVTQL